MENLNRRSWLAGLMALPVFGWFKIDNKRKSVIFPRSEIEPIEIPASFFYNKRLSIINHWETYVKNTFPNLDTNKMLKIIVYRIELDPSIKTISVAPGFKNYYVSFHYDNVAASLAVPVV